MHAILEGGVFDDALDNGRMGGSVSFDAQGVTLTEHGGGRSWQIGWHEMHVTEGGASGKMLFFRNQDTGIVIFTEARGALDQARQASGPAYESIWTEVKEHASKRRLSEGALWGLAIASVVLMVWGLIWAANDGVDYAVEALPTSVDRTLGDSAQDSMAQFGKPVEDEEVRALCLAIFDALKVHAPQDEGFEYRLEILENELPNAFAMPGGQMVILTGLLEIMEGPEEVSGVLAHELAHVYRRHSLRRLLQATGLFTIGQIALGDVTGAAAMLASAAGFAALQHYSREAEEDADLRGVELMHRAGIDPEHLASAFQKLQAHYEKMKAEKADSTPEATPENENESGDAPARDDESESSQSGGSAGEETFDLESQLDSWMSSHPDLESRVTSVRTRSKELGEISKPFSFDLDWSVVSRMKTKKSKEEENTP